LTNSFRVMLDASGRAGPADARTDRSILSGCSAPTLDGVSDRN
jgi:hypothetical protein